MTNFIKKILALSLILSGTAIAREIRNPLPNTVGYLYNPCYRCDHDCRDGNWELGLHGAGYTRFADSAYDKKHGTDKVPLSQLYFGKYDFRLEEAFQGATASVEGNPWVNISTVKPRFDYNERGVRFGGNVAYSFGKDDSWTFGASAGIPYRVIEVERDADASFFTDGLGDVATEKKQTMGDGSSVNVYAVRMDLVNQLGVPVSAAWATTSVKVADKNLSRDTSGTDDVAGHLIGRLDKSVPTGDFAFKYSDAGVGSLAASGVLATDAKAYFDDANDYTALDGNNSVLSKLWLVPTADDIAATSTDITDNAKALGGALKNAIDTSLLADSVVDFLDGKGLNFDSQRVMGFGNLDLAAYLAHRFGKKVWVAAELGGKLGIASETSKVAGTASNKIMDYRKLLAQPLGNNGHHELGGKVTINVSNCGKIALRLDGAGYWAFSAKEKIGATLKTSTIKNIGPEVVADIDWGYFLGHADLIFRHPKTKNMELDLSYELYYKGEDNVKFADATVTDLDDDTGKEVDKALAQADTKVISHKVGAQFAYRPDCLSMYAGVRQSVAGKNSMRDNDFYFGFDGAF